ncbi:hypothetical protein HDU76_004399 [Blyttiomyces sp. JEL0837]|nr:hypothetical protein HDU76_004399 [Blyttiomyces sp. JEL0837]
MWTNFLYIIGIINLVWLIIISYTVIHYPPITETPPPPPLDHPPLYCEQSVVVYLLGAAISHALLMVPSIVRSIDMGIYYCTAVGRRTELDPGSRFSVKLLKFFFGIAL